MRFEKVLKSMVALGKVGISLRRVKYYQTENAMETICIIEDEDAISIGFVRAGRQDIESGRITIREGMRIAEGRAKKARILKTPLLEKNYLRGIYAPKVEEV